VIGARVCNCYGKQLGALVLHEVGQVGYAFGDRPGRGAFAGLQSEEKGVGNS